MSQWKVWQMHRLKLILVHNRLYHMDVSENSGVSPKSSIFIGFSIIFTIHFGVPLFLDCTLSNHHFWHHHLGEYVWNMFPASSRFFQILLSHSKLFLSLRIVSGTIGSILGYDIWIHHLPNKTIKKIWDQCMVYST